MSRTGRHNTFLLLLLVAASLQGCSHRPGPRSAYNVFYQDRLGEVRLPTHEEIASVDPFSQLFAQPTSKVWEACLGLAAQSRGILAVADDPTGGHRLLLITGETLLYRLISAPPQQTFVDRWLAVSVLPLSDTSTNVKVAFVSPNTGRVAPFSADSLSPGFQGERNISISLRSAGAFILALEKTFLEDRYLERFKHTSSPTPRGAPRPLDTKPAARGTSVAHQKANYDSANFRREWFTLNAPRLKRRIADVIHDLAKAAKQSAQEVQIFIIATSKPDLHIEPNGDLFITTGYLDKVMDVDELAGVLSHELAHLYMNHGSSRAGALRRAGASRNMITLTFMLGGAVIHFLATRPDSIAPEDTTFATIPDALVAAAVQLGSYYLSSQIGTSLGRGVGSFAVHRFTRKQELEADEYGAELLWAAGYDYNGLLNFLEREGASLLTSIERSSR